MIVLLVDLIFVWVILEVILFLLKFCIWMICKWVGLSRRKLWGNMLFDLVVMKGLFLFFVDLMVICVYFG